MLASGPGGLRLEQVFVTRAPSIDVGPPGFGDPWILMDLEARPKQNVAEPFLKLIAPPPPVIAAEEIVKTSFKIGLGGIHLGVRPVPVI